MSKRQGTQEVNWAKESSAPRLVGRSVFLLGGDARDPAGGDDLGELLHCLPTGPVTLADLAAKPEQDLDCEVVVVGGIGWGGVDRGGICRGGSFSLAGVRCSAIEDGREWGPLRLHPPRHRHRSRSIRPLAPERPGRSPFAGISADGGQHIGHGLDLSSRRPCVFAASEVGTLVADDGPNRRWPVGRPW